MRIQFRTPAGDRRSGWWSLVLLGFIFARSLCGQPGPAPAEDLHVWDWAVQSYATVSESPVQIQLNWLGDPYTTEYRVYRKDPSENAWTQIGTAPGAASGFTDSSVSMGKAYEYQIIGDKLASKNLLAYGYLLCGIKVPLVESRGRVILLTESSIATDLQTELDAFEYQLIGDGWTVVRDSVGRSDSVQAVKARIRSIYAQDPANTRTLILFGNIPVPYSGDIAPDEHPNHMGAWPADVYYADLDGTWTDVSVNDTQAERATNQNVPGDGKFDQSTPPSSLELEVGRIDLSNLTCYANKPAHLTETDLLRRYLDKNYRFRNGLIRAAQEALLFDAAGGSRQPEPLTARAYRAFPPLVGPAVTQVGQNEFLSITGTPKTYLWSSCTSGGGYTDCDYVATSDQVAVQDVNVVFTTFIGSYFGDWNNESNFLRAALASSGSILTTCYAGKPQWICHAMGLGAHMGLCTKLTQENGNNGIYMPHAPGTGQVHISLLGDPTLRMQPITPVSHLQGSKNGSLMTLNWSASTADGLQGYIVYKAPDRKGPYQRVTSDFITDTAITLPAVKSSDFFMVKAVALTVSPSGTYYNSSQGIYFPDPLSTPPPASLEAIPQSISVTEDNQVSLTLAGTGPDPDSLTYQITANPLHGSLSGSAPQLTYTPNTNFFGSDSFTFTVGDSSGRSSPAQVQITVLGVNHPPTSGDMSLTVGQGLTVTFTVPGGDVDGNPLSYRIVTAPTQGRLVGTLPNVTYDSAPNASGSDMFTYLVNDGQQDSPLGTVTIRIDTGNHPPSAQSLAYSTFENQAVAITLGGDDPDGDSLSFMVDAQPKHGQLSGTAPNLLYTPTNSFIGSDSFTYSVSDGKAAAVEGSVSVQVTPGQISPPQSSNLTLSTAANQPVPVSIPVTGDNGAAVTFVLVIPPAHGQLTGSAPALVYSPSPGFAGTDSFSYALTAGGLQSAVATVTIAINAPSPPPLAQSTTVDAVVGQPLTITLSGIDPTGNSLSYEIITQPTKGSLSGAGSRFTYIAAAGALGTDSLTYVARDATSVSQPATVTINLHQPNHPPSGTNATYQTVNGAPVLITLYGSDPEGDTLHFNVVTLPLFGDLSGTAPNLTYTPHAGAEGLDSFSYTVSDGMASSQAAEITITNKIPPRPALIQTIELIPEGVRLKIAAQNNSTFHTECSFDGKNWTELGRGQCDGTGMGDFLDETRPQPMKLYRLVFQ